MGITRIMWGLVTAAVLAAPISLRAATESTFSEDWNGFTYASMGYVEHWAYTTNDYPGVESYVAAWVDGVTEATSTYGPGYQEITANERRWSSPWFCGTFYGKSNHWLIDGYTWIELEEHLTDSDYSDCEI